MSIKDNVARIRESMARAAEDFGRKPEEITLVAASKTKPTALIREAIDAGVDAVGENRVQEMTEKCKEDTYKGAPLHFIGHLQSNKVNRVVGICNLIESVSSKNLIGQIGRRAEALGITQDVLIEINIGKEPQKSGILPEETEEILHYASQIKGINVHGFMAIPPFFVENERNCYYFDIMFKLFVDMSAKKYDNVSVRLLSMGMSDTYVDAIRFGSNMVRVGSAIFGER